MTNFSEKKVTIEFPVYIWLKVINALKVVKEDNIATLIALDVREQTKEEK